MSRFDFYQKTEELQRDKYELLFKLRIEEERSKGLRKEIEDLKEENAALWELTKKLLDEMQKLIKPTAFAEEVGGDGN